MSASCAYAVKDAAESVTSSTTLQNDDHLSFPIAANEVWVCEIHVHVTLCGSTEDVKVGMTVPTGATLEFMAEHIDSNYAAGSGPWGVTGFTTTSGTGVTLITTSGGPDGMVTIHAWISNGANAGTVQFQWAQGTSSGTALTFGINSFLLAYKVSG